MTHTLSGRPPNMRHMRHTHHGAWPQASHPSPSVTENAIKSMAVTLVTLVTLVTNKPDPSGKVATSVTPTVTQVSRLLAPMPVFLSGGRGVGGGYAFVLCGMGQRSLQRLNPARIKFWFTRHISIPSFAIPPKYRASAPSISSEYSHNSPSKSNNSPLGPLARDSNISSYTAHASSDGGCAWTLAPHNTANVNAINLMTISFLMEGDET